MKLFKIKNENIEQIKNDPFKLERDIQDIVEKNVTTIFDVEFVKSEFKIQNFRFDTLCFDNENNSFVIIEYKKGKSYSVIDQGYTYLSILLNNKSDFILEYNETMNKSLKRDEVDWSQTKIIFVSPKFSEFQKNSINFKNIPFDLWEITRFENSTIGLTKLETTSKEDINTLGSSKNSNIVKNVSKEIIKYDEDYHLFKNKNRDPKIIDLYKHLKEKIFEIGDDIECVVKKQTIGFKRNKFFVDLVIWNGGIGIYLNLKKGQLEDYKNICEDVSNKGHWGNGDYKVTIKSIDDIDYFIYLIKESYQKNI
jgi:predicted transport protein